MLDRQGKGQYNGAALEDRIECYIAMTQRMEVVVGMRARLRKPHPCGSDLWSVTRVGADIGLVCSGCGRRILVEREMFERRVKQIIETPAITTSIQEETS